MKGIRTTDLRSLMLTTAHQSLRNIVSVDQMFFDIKVEDTASKGHTKDLET